MGHLFLIGVAAVIVLICYPLIQFVDTWMFAPFRSRKIRDSGNYKTVEAELISTYPSPDDKGIYHLRYKYTVDGKEYKTWVLTQMYPDTRTTLYYIDDPKNVVGNPGAIGRKRVDKKVLAILIGIVYLVLLVVVKTH